MTSGKRIRLPSVRPRSDYVLPPAGSTQLSPRAAWRLAWACWWANLKHRIRALLGR